MGELIFVGLGLSGTKGLSIEALEALRSCDVIYGEFYTSKLMDSTPGELESMLGKGINILTRKDVEEGDIIVQEARGKRVSFVTAGDTMAATTHVDIRLRAMDEGIPTRLVHGISIFTAVASAFGLQPYKFGRTVTIPFPEPGFHPSSPYDGIMENRGQGLHSLVLLDIKEEEGRYMTAAQAVRWLLDTEKMVGKGLVDDHTLLCAAARVGSPSERLLAGYPDDILEADLGPPLHSLVVPGRLHFMEAKALVALAGAPSGIADEES
jgi:diphthine synthase